MHWFFAFVLNTLLGLRAASLEISGPWSPKGPETSKIVAAVVQQEVNRILGLKYMILSLKVAPDLLLGFPGYPVWICTWTFIPTWYVSLQLG